MVKDVIIVDEFKSPHSGLGFLNVFWFYKIWWPLTCLFKGHRWVQSFWNDDEVFCGICRKNVKRKTLGYDYRLLKKMLEES